MTRGILSIGSIALVHISAKSGKMSRPRGVMAILSPAKTLNLDPFTLDIPTTAPDCDRQKTAEVASQVQKCTNLKKLLGVSDNIAKTAKGYWDDFVEDESERGDDASVKPCIFSFSGAAYQGLEIDSCSTEAIDYLQDNLRIVDPLYGLLRPLDRMQPYRLEMATRNVLKGSTKLADYWKESVSKTLSQELDSRENPILLNLASDEYSAAVDSKLLPDDAAYVKVVFREEGRVIAVHAKRARGLMARFLAENDIQDLRGVKKFALEGYKLDGSKSDDTALVFDRKKGSNKRPSQSKANKTQAKKKRKS